MPHRDKPESYLLKRSTFNQILELIADKATYETKGPDHVEVRVHRDEDGQITSLLETFCKTDNLGGFTPRTGPSDPGTAIFKV